jgi:REP element-mobilizing transposase RayT
VAAALYHVIARGVERRPIFRTEPDRGDFLRRLQGLAGEEDVSVVVFVLMATRFHLLLRRGRTTLAHFMRRLLTG